MTEPLAEAIAICDALLADDPAMEGYTRSIDDALLRAVAPGVEAGSPR